MEATIGRVRAKVASHPRLIVSLLVLLTVFAVSGGAAAVEGTGSLDGVTLGDVGTSDSGGGSAGPTDP